MQQADYYQDCFRSLIACCEPHVQFSRAGANDSPEDFNTIADILIQKSTETGEFALNVGALLSHLSLSGTNVY